MSILDSCAAHSSNTRSPGSRPRSRQRYDLILDCVGNHSFSECRRVLNPVGRLVMVGAPHDVSLIGLLAPMIKTILLSAFVDQKAVMFIANSSQHDLT